jgi:beta-phosphoglucomutase-like phosphatase (HAD superfamily)
VNAQGFARRQRRMTALEAVIFDLDGCLVDSEPLALEALAAEMRALGITSASTQEIRDRFLGVSIGMICAQVAREASLPTPEGFAERFESRAIEAYRSGLRRIDGTRALLDWLKHRNIARAIATGGSIRRMTDTLRLGGLWEDFAGCAFSADQVARGKPAPDLFLFAANGLGVAPDCCVVLEDSPHGVAGAVAAGMRAIGFVGGSHLHDIRESHAARLRAAGANPVVRTLDAVRETIEAANT